MKIVLYTSENIIVEVVENASDIEIDGDSLKWDKGSMRGIKTEFAIVDDTVDTPVGGVFDPSLDKKGLFKKRDLAKEIEQINKRQIEQDLAIVSIFEATLV